MKLTHSKWFSLGQILLWIGLLIAVATGVNFVGIGVAGNVMYWTQWLDNHAAAFSVWRLCLYSATLYGWLWMRRRLYQRTPSSDTRQRLFRAEIGAITVLALLEISLLLRPT